MTMPSTILYAVYPGTVTLYNGSEVTFTAEELATAYGVQDEPYLTVNNVTEIPQGQSYFRYIHLKPRADNYYLNIMQTAQDDGEVTTMGRDFDATKKYTQETNPKTIDKDLDLPHN